MRSFCIRSDYGKEGPDDKACDDVRKRGDEEGKEEINQDHKEAVSGQRSVEGCTAPVVERAGGCGDGHGDPGGVGAVHTVEVMNDHQSVCGTAVVAAQLALGGAIGWVHADHLVMACHL